MPDSVRGCAGEFLGRLPDAARVQEDLLAELLRQHAGCEYGRRHGFAQICSAAEFARRVPIVRYEDLCDDIERMADGEPEVLLSGPVLAIEETGGSSGGRKRIPYTARSLAAFRRGIAAWLDDLYGGDAALARGTAYWSISPAGRAPAKTRGGIPVGLESDLAYLGDELGREIAATLSVSPQIAGIADLEQWRLATCLQLAADEELALISVWSPTFLLQLIDGLEKHAHAIVRCIERGFDGRAPDPTRAAQVAAVLGSPSPDYSALWPALRLISCWTQGSSRAFAARLAQHFPRVALQGKGLLATEALVSLPFRALDWPVLAFESAYIELLDDSGVARPATSAEVGGEYQVLITNESGLFRYAIGDRVRVQGFCGAAPLLEFLGRAGVSSDLVGEKLDESFVARALATLGLEFAALAADGNGYALLLDEREVAREAAPELVKRCDDALRANPQYAYARDLGQLTPLRAVRSHDPLDCHVNSRIRAGQRLGDIKPPALLTDATWRATFSPADAAA